MYIAHLFVLPSLFYSSAEAETTEKQTSFNDHHFYDKLRF